MIAQYRPQLLGAAPPNIMVARIIVEPMLGNPVPVWWFNAVALTILAAVFALVGALAAQVS